MIDSIKAKAIKLLGGVSASEHDELKAERDKLQAEHDLYMDFAKSIYTYAGSYPVWKAQSEYRQMLEEIGHPLFDEHSVPPQRAELLDIYLGRVVDSFAQLIGNTPQAKIWGRNKFWGKDQLPEARGDYFLKKRSQSEPGEVEITEKAEPVAQSESMYSALKVATFLADAIKAGSYDRRSIMLSLCEAYSFALLHHDIVDGEEHKRITHILEKMVDKYLSHSASQAANS